MAKYKYYGETGIFSGKVFIHGFRYRVEVICFSHQKTIVWLRVKGAEIPYTRQGLRQVWGDRLYRRVWQ